MDMIKSIVFKAVMENNIEVIKEVLNRHKISLKDLTNEKDNVHLVYHAVNQNHRDMVLFLVENGANINSGEFKSVDMSPLLLSISQEYVQMTKLLLDLGVNVEEGQLNQNAICPLHFAASCLSLEVVILLLARGANVNARDTFNDETALHLLCNYNYIYNSERDKKLKMQVQVKIAKALLEFGAAMDATNRQGLMPVDCALSRNKTELCKLLFVEGAPVRKTNTDGTYLDYLKYVVICPLLTRLCLERGCDFKHRYKENGFLTPYHDALQFSQPDVVKIFLEFSCPFDLPVSVPGTPTFVVFYTPNDENLTLLTIQKAFIAGIRNNSLKSVKAALKQGAEAKGCSMDMPSTLHYVAEKGNHELVELLLKKGVPVNSVNTRKETPLFVAVKNKNVKASEVLLKFGACFNLHLSDRNNLNLVIENCDELKKLFKSIKTCFKLVKQGNNKVLKFLKNYSLLDDNNMLSVTMNCVNRRGLSLMAVALQMGHTEIAKGLMKLRIEKL